MWCLNGVQITQAQRSVEWIDNFKECCRSWSLVCETWFNGEYLQGGDWINWGNKIWITSEGESTPFLWVTRVGIGHMSDHKEDCWICDTKLALDGLITRVTFEVEQHHNLSITQTLDLHALVMQNSFLESLHDWLVTLLLSKGIYLFMLAALVTGTNDPNYVIYLLVSIS